MTTYIYKVEFRPSHRLFTPPILILFLLSPYLFSNLVFTLFMGLDQRLWLIFKFSCRNSISS